MKKSTIAAFVSGALLFGSVGVFAGQYMATENPFPVQLNGNNVSLEGYNINDSTYFKLRDIANVVGGFTVDFKDNTILLTKDGHSNNNSPAGYVFETPEPKTIIPTAAPTPEPTTVPETTIDYPTSFTYYNEDRGYEKANITSFKIASIDNSGFLKGFSDTIKINLEITGTVDNDEYLYFEMSCYDKDGYLLDTVTVAERITKGKEFKIKKTALIPGDTVKIVFE